MPVPREEGGVPRPESHAFRPEAPQDSALQCPEQELLCYPDPPTGQQCHRVHAVGGEHRAGMPGGRGSETGTKGGESSMRPPCVVGTGSGGLFRGTSYLLNVLAPAVFLA